MPALTRPTITVRTPSIQILRSSCAAISRSRGSRRSFSREEASGPGSRSGTSSGKSMPTSIRASRARTFCRIDSISSLSRPFIWRAAMTSPFSDRARMRSTTASAWVRSMRPFMKALKVNSPGLARRAPERSDDLEDPGEQEGTAVAVDLHHVFPGVGMGGLHEGEQHLVHHGPGVGVHQMTQVESMALKGLNGFPGPEQPFGDVPGQGPAQADDPDAPLSHRGGYGGNRVFHGRVVRLRSPLGDDDDPLQKPFPPALGVESLIFLEGQMDDAPLLGVERARGDGFLDLFGLVPHLEGHLGQGLLLSSCDSFPNPPQR